MFRSITHVARPLPFALAFAGALALAACEPMALNTPQTIAQERQAGQQLAQQLQARDALYEDPALTAYVQNIVSRIDRNRPTGAPRLQTYIVKDADVNAFTPGGGTLFVNAGLIAAMQNEAQLATVLAHEIAHIDRGHVQAARSRQAGVQLGAAAAQIGGALLGLPPQLTEFGVGLGAQYAVSSFTRTQELDADELGVQYLAAAGYDVDEGARSFEVLRSLYGDRAGPAAWFSTHPPTAERQQIFNQAAIQLDAAEGRVARAEYDRATRNLRQQVLNFYERSGRTREAALIRHNLASG